LVANDRSELENEIKKSKGRSMLNYSCHVSQKIDGSDEKPRHHQCTNMTFLLQNGFLSIKIEIQLSYTEEKIY
jgi:hypothetical protein